MINRARSQFLSLCVASLACGVSLAADPEPRGAQSSEADHWVSLLQNERDAIPYSSIVTIDPAEELRFRMALAADLRADRIARQQAAGDDALVSAQRSRSSDFQDVQVTLIQPNLDKRKLQANSDGTLGVSNLMPGVNVFVATGENSHGVQTLFVKMRGADAPPAEASDTPRVIPLVTASRSEILPVIESYAPSRLSQELGTIEDIKKVVTADDRGFDYVVRLSTSNMLAGQLISLMQDSDQRSMIDTNVVLFQGGRVVARGLSDQLGRFAFNNISPGVYGIIAAGPAGYAAFSFEAIEAAGFVQRRNLDDHQFVSQALADVPVVLVPPPMVPEVVRSTRDQYDVLAVRDGDPMLAEDGLPAPFGPQGFAAGGGGGGFGGGGGGGGGSIAALAAVGGIIAAVVSSNDDGLQIPVVTSPVIP